MFYRTFSLVLVALLAVLSVGCGDKQGYVSGTVRLGGKPLSNTIVTFTPATSGSTGSGLTDAEGKYKLQGVDGPGLAPGQYKVYITTAPPTAAPAAELDMNSPEYLSAASGSANESQQVKAPKEIIPAKYNSNSQVTKEIQLGNQTIDFELELK